MQQRKDPLIRRMIGTKFKNKEDKQLFDKISTHISTNYSDHYFCVQSLCDLTGKSQPTLYRKFIMLQVFHL